MQDINNERHNFDTTKKDKPSGLSGWLIIVAIGLFLQPIFLYVTISRVNLPLINDKEVWHTLTSPNSEGYIPNFSYLVYYELIGNVLLFAVGIVLLILFFQKKTPFPKVFIWFLFANIIFIFLDDIFADNMFKNVDVLEGLNDGFAYRETAKSLISTAIWFPYMLISKRVKNTFVN